MLERDERLSREQRRHGVDEEEPEKQHVQDQDNDRPPPGFGRPGQLRVQVDQHEREDDRRQGRHVARKGQQVGRQRQVDHDRDHGDEEDGDPVVSPARVAADPPAQAGAHGDGGVRRVAGQVMCFRLQLSWRLADAAFAR